MGGSKNKLETTNMAIKLETTDMAFKLETTDMATKLEKTNMAIKLEMINMDTKLEKTDMAIKQETTNMAIKQEKTDMATKLEKTHMAINLETTDMAIQLEMTDMTRKLPPEMMERIFLLLPLRSLKMVVLVCRRWRELGEDPVLWSQLWLTVNERKLSFMSEMLSSRRLQFVMMLIIETPLTEEVLQSVMRHPGLSHLKLLQDTLTSQGAELFFSAISEDSQLKCVNISKIDLSSVDPRLLAGAVKKLSCLHVDSVHLTEQQTESIIAAICQGSKLKHLRISESNLSSVNPRLLAGAVKKLETLDVGYGKHLTTKQIEAIFVAINQGSQLKTLDISYNDLSPVNPMLLAQAVNKLVIVKMWFGKLTPNQTKSMFEAITKDSQLKSLELYGTDLNQSNATSWSSRAAEHSGCDNRTTDNTANRINHDGNQ